MLSRVMRALTPARKGKKSSEEITGSTRISNRASSPEGLESPTMRSRVMRTWIPCQQIQAPQMNLTPCALCGDEFCADQRCTLVPLELQNISFAPVQSQPPEPPLSLSEPQAEPPSQRQTEPQAEPQAQSQADLHADAEASSPTKRRRCAAPQTSVVPITAHQISRIDVQVAMVLDVTGSMGNMLAGAKSGLEKAWRGVQAAVGPQETPEVAVVCYRDYCDSVVPAQFSNRGMEDANRVDHKKMLKYSGIQSSTPQFFRDPSLVTELLAPEEASGGGDMPEMVEVALATAACLPWNGQIQSLYLALDAPPHSHGSGIQRCGDQWPSLEKIRMEQQDTLFQSACGRFLAQQEHPEDWLTQVVLLARAGVIVNPMICTESPDVVFFASFLAELTGGQAVFIADASGWSTADQNNLENYVREYTKLEIAEKAQLADEAAVQRIAAAITNLPNQYRMRVPGPEVVNTMYETMDITQIKRELVLKKLESLADYAYDSFSVAHKIAPLYNRALASAVGQRAAPADPVAMSTFVVSNGESRSMQFLKNRMGSVMHQQSNYHQGSSMFGLCREH